MLNKKADIVIAGAGLVGALTALVLARGFPHWHVVLLDPQTGTPRQDPRTIALALRTQQVLCELGVWADVSGATSIKHIHISDSTGPGSASLHAAKEKVDSLGYVAQATAIQAALGAACSKEPSIEWLQGACIENIVATDHSQQLHLNNGQVLDTRLLIVTDGSQSPTRTKLGIQMDTTAYGQTAIAGFIETEQSHNQVAYERFTPEGPLALLPCGPKQFALVWCAKTATANNLLALPEDEFRHRAQELFGSRAGYFVTSERAGAFPLNLSVAQRFIGHRFAVIGNACHTLHPVAGQGYNLGVRDVLVLKQVLANAQDPGDMAVLNTYEARRKPDYRHVQTFTDSLVRLFSSSDPCASITRRCGLKAMRIVPVLAKPIAQKAMGFGAQETLWR
ncbi:MAG TPA: FAD-dependent monooxygenase [Aliidiomarina sp.]|nr:FAD-dependent monooxygenase [Aliidiomarina sp.]